eukprot:UN06304
MGRMVVMVYVVFETIVSKNHHIEL